MVYSFLGSTGISTEMYVRYILVHHITDHMQHSDSMKLPGMMVVTNRQVLIYDWTKHQHNSYMAMYFHRQQSSHTLVVVVCKFTFCTFDFTVIKVVQYSSIFFPHMFSIHSC